MNRACGVWFGRARNAELAGLCDDLLPVEMHLDVLVFAGKHGEIVCRAEEMFRMDLGICLAANDMMIMMVE
jgi:hypothetical protein